MSEKVLVFPEEIFNLIGAFKGFSKDAGKFLNDQRFVNSLHYVDRVFAETTSRIRQVIPYLLLSKEDKYLVYERGGKGGETRLHGRLSLGCGGHVNPDDRGHYIEAAPMGAYHNGMCRELEEEVGLTGPFKNELLGCIYIVDSEVDKVHMGFCHRIVLDNDFIPEFRDEALQNGEFWSVEKIKENVSRFENWSQILIREVL